MLLSNTRPVLRRNCVIAVATVFFFILVSSGYADTSGSGGASPEEPVVDSGGAAFGLPTAKPDTSTVESQKFAVAGTLAPLVVQQAIDSANSITSKPYKWGGGHRDWNSRGYDCSGAVSFVLHGAGFLSAPLASGGLARWGDRGRGRWITVFANAGHAFIVIDDMRFDTSGRGQDGPRWRKEKRSFRGYRARHPAGF